MKGKKGGGKGVCLLNHFTSGQLLRALSRLLPGMGRDNGGKRERVKGNRSDKRKGKEQRERKGKG